MKQSSGTRRYFCLECGRPFEIVEQRDGLASRWHSQPQSSSDDPKSFDLLKEEIANAAPHTLPEHPDIDQELDKMLSQAAQLQIGYPMCVECSRTLGRRLEDEIERARADQAEYARVLADLERLDGLEHAEGSALTNDPADPLRANPLQIPSPSSDALQELERQCNALQDQLQAAEAERRALQETSRAVDEEERCLAARESAFWSEFNTVHARAQQDRETEAALRHHVEQAEAHLQWLQSTNLRKTIFTITHATGAVPSSINGLRICSKAHASDLNCREVSAAFGMCVFLLDSLRCDHGISAKAPPKPTARPLTPSRFDPQALGSFSAIAYYPHAIEPAFTGFAGAPQEYVLSYDRAAPPTAFLQGAFHLAAAVAELSVLVGVAPGHLTVGGPLHALLDHARRQREQDHRAKEARVPSPAVHFPFRDRARVLPWDSVDTWGPELLRWLEQLLLARRT